MSPQSRAWKYALIVLISGLLSSISRAIGPENVAVLVNRRDSESMAVGNHYRVQRDIPDSNVIVLDFVPNRKEMSWDYFSRTIYNPMLATLDKRRLRGQIGVIVTTPSFPYRIGQNGISGCLFFGREEKAIATYGPANFPTTNGYMDRCESFVPPPPSQAPMFLHMHLDAGTLGATFETIDRSVLADGTNPKGTVYLLDGEGARASRKDSIPFASRLLENLDVKNVASTTSYLRGRTDVLGMYSGVPKFPVTENRYVKGALGDLLTSVSGQLLDAHSQTRAWDWLAAGCSATYGAVVEPYNYPQKFPSAKVHVYYAMGFTAAEAYWMSVAWPQQGLFLGDPLTRPFGTSPQIKLEGLSAEQVFRGPVKFSVIATAAGDAPGVASLEMFLDDRPLGAFRRTVLPSDVTLKLRINDIRLEGKLKANGKLIDILADWQNQLAKVGIDTIVAAGLLVLLIPADTAKPPVIEASSDHPFVYAKAQPISLPRGKQAAGSVPWLVEGSPELGDKVTLELMETNASPQRYEFQVSVPMSAAELALRMTTELAPKLPKGYRFDGEISSLGGKRVGRMTLKSPSGLLRSNPRVRVSVAPTPGSTLKLTPADVLMPLIDATLNSYAVGMVRFGIGEDRIRVNADLPLADMDDGRHVLRFVAKRGWPSQPNSRQIVPFVVAKSPYRLQLISKDPAPGIIRLFEKQKPIAVVKAVLTENNSAAIEYTVDGQATLQSEKNAANELIFDPKRYGVGIHTISAMAKPAGGKPIRADNALVVEVLP